MKLYSILVKVVGGEWEVLEEDLSKDEKNRLLSEYQKAYRHVNCQFKLKFKFVYPKKDNDEVQK